MFGKLTAGNGVYALVQVLQDGDMIFTSVTGPGQRPALRLDPKPIEPGTGPAGKLTGSGLNPATC